MRRCAPSHSTQETKLADHPCVRKRPPASLTPCLLTTHHSPPLRHACLQNSPYVPLAGVRIRSCSPRLCLYAKKKNRQRQHPPPQLPPPNKSRPRKKVRFFCPHVLFGSLLQGLAAGCVVCFPTAVRGVFFDAFGRGRCACFGAGFHLF